MSLSDVRRSPSLSVDVFRCLSVTDGQRRMSLSDGRSELFIANLPRIYMLNIILIQFLNFVVAANKYIVSQCIDCSFSLIKLNFIDTIGDCDYMQILYLKRGEWQARWATCTSYPHPPFLSTFSDSTYYIQGLRSKLAFNFDLLN